MRDPFKLPRVSIMRLRPLCVVIHAARDPPVDGLYAFSLKGIFIR